jgi:outer membrane protein
MRMLQAFRIAVILGSFLGLLGGLPPGSAAARSVTIGVVRDGPVARGDLVPRVEEELHDLVSDDVTIRFKSVPEFDAGWDGTRIRTVLENALSDPEVDIVLGAGYVAAVTAARDDVLLTKPFVSAPMHRADIPKLPLSEAGRWMKVNFSATVLTQRTGKDMQELERVLSPDTLHVGIDSLEADYLTGLRDVLEDYERTYGFKVILVRVAGNAGKVIAGLPEGVEMFYLTEMPRLAVEGRRQLIAGLTARGVPTFSMVGRSDVELGALMTAVPDMDRQMVKRIALNISRIIRGAAVSDLPVFMTVDTRVLINGKTAAAVGYYPDFEVRAFARFIHRDALEQSEDLLTLEGAFEAAEKGNVGLAIKDADVESAYRSKKRALSPMLPQILGAASYMKDEPVLDTGLFPTELSAAGVRVSQMIFDDRVISDYRSFDRLHESSEFRRETERLDVLASAGQSYLEFALARVLSKVQADNVQLTEDNLELSKIRYEVGYSGKDEVFRWEAELAQGRTQLLRINTTVEAARISLNQILGVEQDLRWMPEEFEVDPAAFAFLGEKLESVFKNPDALDAFRELMIGLAYETSPELATYDKVIEAQEIQYGQRKRKFLLPKLFANFTYDYHIGREPSIENARDDTYRFELGATYPVFSGADRFQDMKLQEALLEGLRQERELARQRVEQRVRTAIRRLESSFPSIRLTRQAAVSSRLNLEVVRDKYGQGIVNITDLLEAQNQTFTADQNAAAATYSFLGDLIRLQRAISWFEYDHTEEERNELARRISEAVAEDQRSP